MVCNVGGFMRLLDLGSVYVLLSEWPLVAAAAKFEDGN